MCLCVCVCVGVCVCEVVQEGLRGRRVEDVREHTANHTIAL